MININIKPLDSQSQEDARSRQSTLTKPPGSLGKLEELSAQLAGIYQNPMHKIEKKMTEQISYRDEFLQRSCCR